MVDIEPTAEFEEGRFYEFRGAFVYVLAGTSEQVSVDVADTEETAWAATDDPRRVLAS